MPGERARAFAESDHAMLARLLQSRRAADAPFRRVPVVVLTRGLDMTDGLSDNHAALARLSRSSRHSIVRDSGHEVHLFAPDAVIEAIREVTAAAVKALR
jgi:pimeloyl-ACP methyl ester carboxylesterase